jgi:hypothetical protein
MFPPDFFQNTKDQLGSQRNLLVNINPEEELINEKKEPKMRPSRKFKMLNEDVDKITKKLVLYDNEIEEDCELLELFKQSGFDDKSIEYN